MEWVEGLVDESAGDVDAAYRHIERGLVLLDELGMGQEVTAQAGRLITLAERRGKPELAAQWRKFVAGRTGGLTRHDVLLQASASNVEAHHARTAGTSGSGLRGASGGARRLPASRGAGAPSPSPSPASGSSPRRWATRAAPPRTTPRRFGLPFEPTTRARWRSPSRESPPASVTARAEWAATLLGAADRWWTEPGTEPSHREDVAVTTARVRLSLGNTSFATAHDRGRRLDRVAAVDLARTPPLTPAPTDPR